VARAWEQARSLEDSQKDVEGATKALRQVLSHLEKSRRRAPDRVRLARATARELGMPEAEVGLFSYAASIHDLGMTGVGERIREGGGPLSPDQRELLESHPEKSIELLGPLQTMGAVRDIVLSHHEWWDGSGYPRGLQGDEIPLGARVLAVVDAFESMTVGRAHRSPFSREDALRELGNLCGRQFDPVVVEAFARVVQADDLQQEAA
jgi:HD-GYP domain-containing protein (c-di-GMP phosphodiesterase class II)